MAPLRWLLVAGFSSVPLGFVIGAAFFALTCCRLARQIQEIEEQSFEPFPPSLLGHWAASTYIIGTLELIIHRNAVAPGIKLWTFGQILMLIGPLMELGGAVLGKLNGDTSRACSSID